MDVFAPAGRADARARLGLDPQRIAVLLCTGSLAFGEVDRAVTALLAAGPQVQVIAVCGRNGHLRGHLAARGEPSSRLRVVGWTDAMQDWMTAADVVVTNGGGVTALEAIACSRPVIMFEPIAGHGRANAALMASCGAALLPTSPRELTAVVSGLAADPVARAELAGAALAAAGNRRREDDLAALGAMPGSGGPPVRPVPAEDAFFLHVQAAGVPQQVGAVVTMACPGVDLSRLRAEVAVRAGRIPQLRRHLVPARGRWARARWVEEETVDVARRITEVTRGAGVTPASLDEIASSFFAAPLDPRQDAWQMLLVHAPPAAPAERSAIMVKVHHALGDSYTIISALSGLFDLAGGWHPRGVGRPRPAAARAGAIFGMPGRVTRAARGLAGMALAGPAPCTSLTGKNSPGRRFASVTLPARGVTITARRLGGSPADLVLALVAEALGRIFAARGEPADGRTVRVMVPHTLRAARAAPRPTGPGALAPGESAHRGLPGNRAAGLLLDLPVGRVCLADRVRTVHLLWRARLRRGDVGASAAVLRATRLLPVPLQRAFARRCYTGRRFNLIVSVFPGVRQPSQLLGTQIAEVYPVLALADGVGLAIGAMTWGQSLAIGLLADEALVPDLGALAREIERAFAAAGPDPGATGRPGRFRPSAARPHRRRITSAGQRG
jgi:WS/DGAT/MGAT family acyltransferase